MDNVLSFFSSSWSIVVAILVLAVLIMVHELGHFLSARAVGIRVDEFAIGMGPKIFGFKGKVTQYSLRLIPLGGYCRYHGEDEELDDEEAFNRQPVWKRFISVICGPVMNIVLAFIIILLLLAVFGYTDSVPRVGSISENSAAMEAGMMVGDTILSANGTEITNVVQLQDIIKSSPNMPIEMLLQNDSGLRTLTVTPRVQENGSAIVGILFDTDTVRQPLGTAIGRSFNLVVTLVKEMVGFLKGLVTERQGVDDISGPLGIVTTISDTAREGGPNLLLLMAFISINLGVMNMLPIPALDGSRLIFLIIEAIRRKPFDRNREAMVHLIGLGALMLLIVVVTYKDIVRLFQ